MKQPKKYGGYVELTEDIVGDTSKSLIDWIHEARVKALHEGIKANTVMIDEHFAKVNGFYFSFNQSIVSLPPMICGLQVYVTKEDLPDGYDFGLLEVPMTEREALIRNTERDIAKKIFEDIECAMCLSERQHRPFNSSDYVDYYDIKLEDQIAEVRAKYLEEEKGEGSKK